MSFRTEKIDSPYGEITVELNTCDWCGYTRGAGDCADWIHVDPSYWARVHAFREGEDIDTDNDVDLCSWACVSAYADERRTVRRMP